MQDLETRPDYLLWFFKRLRERTSPKMAFREQLITPKWLRTSIPQISRPRFSNCPIMCCILGECLFIITDRVFKYRTKLLLRWSAPNTILRTFIKFWHSFPKVNENNKSLVWSRLKLDEIKVCFKRFLTYITNLRNFLTIWIIGMNQSVE